MHVTLNKLKSCHTSTFKSSVRSSRARQGNVASLPKQAEEPPSGSSTPAEGCGHPAPNHSEEFLFSCRNSFPRSLLKLFTLLQSCQKCLPEAGTQIQGMAATVGSETWDSGDFCSVIQHFLRVGMCPSWSSTCPKCSSHQIEP